MNFELKSLTPAALANEACDALIVLVPKAYSVGKDAIGQLIAKAHAAGDLETAVGKALQLYQPARLQARRVLLVGVGEGSAQQVMQAVHGAAAVAKSAGKHVLVSLNWLATVDAARLNAAVCGANDATYAYTLTKSKPDAPKVQSITVAVGDTQGLDAAWAQAVAVAMGVNVAKEWGNRPANHATPTLLGEAAKKIAKAKRMSCEVLGPKQIEALRMGSFMAVAQGSVEPARFIVLQYKGADKSVAPKVLVGKGITFDTGGISIKPSAAMDEMKFDMCGAASVLGTFAALAELQPPINVVGLIPACENMPDGRAIKPGDVVRSMSGQTIEILNTDAEGRLILCDALTYAERFNPAVVVDIATLTGACVIALGHIRSGMYASEDGLAQDLLEAGDAALDLCWRMPLDDDYADALKSNFADMGNVGGRAGGSITAAKFLQKFAQQYPWAHLDIAGTAWKEGAAKGATGRPVGLLVNYLLHAKRSGTAASKPSAKKGKSGKSQASSAEASRANREQAALRPVTGGVEQA